MTKETLIWDELTEEIGSRAKNDRYKGALKKAARQSRICKVILLQDS